jgi:hypothetical protein
LARISTPQQDGEIVISLAGDPPMAFSVTDGAAEVPADQIAMFLATVAGSALTAEDPPKAKTSSPAPAKEA